MDLATTLKTRSVRVNVRELGINANYWYAIGWATDLKPAQVIQVTIWQQDIVVYRDVNGQLRALENRCPHKGVSLHRGRVMGQHLACSYHGWEFNPQGQCVKIPYLPPEQPLPCAQVRSYPIQESNGLIWIFPGDPDRSHHHQPPEMPEYGQPGWLDIPITGHFQAHFSICNENSMDVFHGFLHEKLQGWFDPVLLKLRETESTVSAEYQVSYQGWIAKFLGLSERADAVTTLPITVQYRYPHYQSELRGVSSLYLMRLPVSPTESRSFAVFFFKIRLPQSLLNLLKPVLRSLLQRFVLYRFLEQDVEMMESEQQNYSANPQRRCVEINPAIIAVQRLITRQFEQYQRETREFQDAGHKATETNVDESTWNPSEPAISESAFSQGA